MPATSRTKVLLHLDFLNIVIWRVQRAENMYNCVHSVYKLQTAGPLCTGKHCCCPVFCEGGLWPPFLNVISWGLQPADRVYN